MNYFCPHHICHVRTEFLGYEADPILPSHISPLSLYRADTQLLSRFLPYIRSVNGNNINMDIVISRVRVDRNRRSIQGKIICRTCRLIV